MIEQFLTQWHRVVENKQLGQLNDLLDDNAVMVSPVLYAPQKGKEITFFYLQAAFNVFLNDSFQYLRVAQGPGWVVLEFETSINGMVVNGVDMITINEAGKIIEFKVMVRPLSALNLIRELMRQQLEQSNQ